MASTRAIQCLLSIDKCNIMKLKPSFTLLLAIFLALITCSSQYRATCVTTSALSREECLIGYLSPTGATEAVAEIIRQEVGGEMVELKLETPCPDDYDAIVAQVDQENERGYLPP